MRIEVRNGPQSRLQVLPLFTRVYPEAVLRNVAWRNVVSAPAEERVMLLDDADHFVACVGLIIRTGLMNERLARIGGVGGVMVAPERQKQGLGRMVMMVAHNVLRA